MTSYCRFHCIVM
uniref:Uncharacterized protein n=1 Tax=Anguilla anguilla TaxID=7936 RepID=A0A0E9QYH8_ANGAN